MAGYCDNFSMIDGDSSNFSMNDGGDKFVAFPGLKGEDGTTFYPHVSAEGILSWTNDGGKPNPDPVNIKGTDGKSAYQAAVEAGFSGTEAEFNEYLSGIGDMTEEVDQQKSALTDLADLVDRKAGMLVDEVSGAIASFVPDATIPDLLGVTVDVEPVQAGSGDPSPDNVRPISGWSAVGIPATGKNLIDSSNAISGLCGYRAGDTLDTVVASTRYSHSVQIPARSGLKLSYRSNNISTFNQCLIECFVGQNWASAITGDAVSDTSTVRVLTVPANTYDWVKVMYSAPSGGVVGTNINGEIQLETGSTASAYTPFAGNTYTIQLGQTVYGGTLDAVNGTLTVDKVMLGNVTWRKHPTYSYVFYAPSGTGQLVNSITAISNVCALYSGGTLALFASDSEYRFRIGDYIYINIPSVSNVTDLNTWIANNSLQICYELATPITITLDPVTIATISGQTNNVWADAGDVSVEFAADIKAYIDRMNQPTEDDMIANSLIASGKYFTVNNRLFLSTASIAAGAQIIPGTNCTETSLAAALNALNA